MGVPCKYGTIICPGQSRRPVVSQEGVRNLAPLVYGRSNPRLHVCQVMSPFPLGVELLHRLSKGVYKRGVSMSGTVPEPWLGLVGLLSSLYTRPMRAMDRQGQAALYCLNRGSASPCSIDSTWFFVMGCPGTLVICWDAPSSGATEGFPSASVISLHRPASSLDSVVSEIPYGK